MRRPIRRIGMGCALLALGPSAIAAAPRYAVEKTFHVEGDRRWDLLSVDDSSGRIFLSHGDRVQVVDSRSGKLLGTIPGIDGAHGVALVPELGKGFATSGKDSAVVVFDMKTYATLARLPAGGVKPDAAFFEPVSKRVFIGLAGSDAVSVFDATTSRPLGTIHLPGNPELFAADGKGMLYVNIENMSRMVAIDAGNLNVTATWPLAPGEEPTGLAMDPATNRLFAGCANHMLVVLDAVDGKMVSHLPVGGHIDGVVFDRRLKRAYASGGDGTLTVIQEEGADHFVVLERVATKEGARTVALDSKTHHLYLPTAEFGPVPAASAEHPRPHPSVLPGTFAILDISPRE